ncbi:hypothetical protein FJT64_000133 [Amphibalanus amphitrite]|uniref:Uncharacterized protein n=1 Tax=Amphibalanus amphitrite TaxID=1232801 RepID=A0A6A4VIY4_AMPAM|nr:hypothetical protein FJT64_000133 [Amphibalanus amphitrite]
MPDQPITRSDAAGNVASLVRSSCSSAIAPTSLPSSRRVSSLSSSLLPRRRSPGAARPGSALQAGCQVASLLLLTASCLALIGCAYQLFYTSAEPLLTAGLLLSALNVAQQLLLVVAVARASCRLLLVWSWAAGAQLVAAPAALLVWALWRCAAGGALLRMATRAAAALPAAVVLAGAALMVRRLRAQLQREAGGPERDRAAEDREQDSSRLAQMVLLKKPRPEHRVTSLDADHR